MSHRIQSLLIGGLYTVVLGVLLICGAGLTSLHLVVWVGVVVVLIGGGLAARGWWEARREP